MAQSKAELEATERKLLEDATANPDAMFATVKTILKLLADNGTAFEKATDDKEKQHLRASSRAGILFLMKAFGVLAASMIGENVKVVMAMKFEGEKGFDKFTSNANESIIDLNPLSEEDEEFAVKDV